MLVGDAEVGKSSLVQVMGTNKFLEEYKASVADNYEIEGDYNGKPVTMNIWDLGT